MRTRSRQKQQQRLKVRKTSHGENKNGERTPPGSQNPHKSASLSTKLRANKKGNRR